MTEDVRKPMLGTQNDASKLGGSHPGGIRGRQLEEATEGGRSPTGKPIDGSPEGRTLEARPEARKEARKEGRREDPKEGRWKPPGSPLEDGWKAAGRSLEGRWKTAGGDRKEDPDGYRSHVPNKGRDRREDGGRIARTDKGFEADINILIRLNTSILIFAY